MKYDGKPQSRVHTEKLILNLINSNQILIVITQFRLIYLQKDFRLVLNLSNNGNYNPNLDWINKILKEIFLCAFEHSNLYKDLCFSLNRTYWYLFAYNFSYNFFLDDVRKIIIIFIMIILFLQFFLCHGTKLNSVGFKTN